MPANEKPPAESLEDLFEELNEDGVQPKPVDPPVDPIVLAHSRTETVHDPLTTSLLAEVARNASTVELSPEQIAQAMQGEEEPPRVSPSVIRRKLR